MRKSYTRINCYAGKRFTDNVVSLEGSIPRPGIMVGSLKNYLQSGLIGNPIS